MRKIAIGMYAGCAGTDAWEFYEVPDDISDDELSEFAWQRGKDHAEAYGIYPREEYSDTEEFDEDDECYSDNIEGWWEDYDPKLHDGHAIGGKIYWKHY
jgi:hypothetical protein